MRDDRSMDAATTPIPPSELPSPGALKRATAIAGAAAALLLVVAVLPAEYNVDPTGVGRVLGLKEMGQIKQEAAADAADSVNIESARAVTTPTLPAPTGAPTPASASADSGVRADTISVALHPDEGKEIKLVMRKGERVRFAWSTDRGVVNFETHGDTLNAPRGVFHSYGKGRDARANAGEFVAVFDGHHGWFWRNRGREVVTITLRTEGQYHDVKRF